MTRASWSVAPAAALLVLGQAAAPAVPPQPAPFDFFKAPSLTAPAAAGMAGFSMPPVAGWRWHAGQPGCALSPIGARVDQVVRDITRKIGPAARLTDEDLITTTRNAWGPTLMDAEAIFTAAGRLIEAADHEVDIMSFAMEPDAQPYLELLRAFERRLRASRPLARPFRLRIYTDHISTLFMGGLARPKARSLLAPWLELFRTHRLDPGAVQLELYVHAHGSPFYHHGTRFSAHDKMLIADGVYLHLGGANPQARNNYARPERDTAVVVKGEIATAALGAFDALWSRADFACTIAMVGPGHGIRCADRRVPFTVDHSDAVRRPAFGDVGLPADACLPMILLSKGKRAYWNVAGYSNPWAKGMLAAVAASTQSIDLTSPNFNAPPLQGALIEAMAQRNVALRLLLPFERNESQVNGLGGFGSNARTVRVLRACAVAARARSEAEFARLTRNFQGGWWVAEGERERFSGDGPGCAHTKFASFDDRVLVAGSANLDDQSFYHSSETSILVDSATVTKAVSGFVFLPEWNRAERFGLFTRLPDEPLGSLAPWPDSAAADARSLCSGLGYRLE